MPGRRNVPQTGSERVRESLAEARARRRQHRRDLPAKIRRRQAIAVGVVGVVVIGGGYSLVSGGGNDDGKDELAVKRLVGQSMVTKLGKAGPDRELLRKVRRGQIGGVIVKNGVSADDVAGHIADLQTAAEQGGNPPLLVMIDQEGGEVRSLRPGPPSTSPEALGEGGTADESRAAGEATGEFLAEFGINVNLAPVLDVTRDNTAETLSSRTFGDDPDRVAELGSAFAEGLELGGVAATAKHFPGLGLATLNTDFSPAEIAAPGSAHEEALIPFTAAVEAGVDLVMVSSAIYPNYDPDNAAVFSRKVTRGLLRKQVGFDGVVITDDLEAIGVTEIISGDARVDRQSAALDAIRAGSDVLLYASSKDGATFGFNALVRSVKAGQISRARMDATYQRILALKAKLAAQAAPAPAG